MALQKVSNTKHVQKLSLCGKTKLNIPHADLVKKFLFLI
jgi:hypothetical protein